MKNEREWSVLQVDSLSPKYLEILESKLNGNRLYADTNNLSENTRRTLRNNVNKNELCDLKAVTRMQSEIYLDDHLFANKSLLTKILQSKIIKPEKVIKTNIDLGNTHKNSETSSKSYQKSTQNSEIETNYLILEAVQPKKHIKTETFHNVKKSSENESKHSKMILSLYRFSKVVFNDFGDESDYTKNSESEVKRAESADLHSFSSIDQIRISLTKMETVMYVNTNTNVEQSPLTDSDLNTIGKGKSYEIENEGNSSRNKIEKDILDLSKSHSNEIGEEIGRKFSSLGNNRQDISITSCPCLKEFITKLHSICSKEEKTPEKIASDLKSISEDSKKIYNRLNCKKCVEQNISFTKITDGAKMFQQKCPLKRDSQSSTKVKNSKIQKHYPGESELATCNKFSDVIDLKTVSKHKIKDIYEHFKMADAARLTSESLKLLCPKLSNYNFKVVNGISNNLLDPDPDTNNEPQSMDETEKSTDDIREGFDLSKEIKYWCNDDKFGKILFSDETSNPSKKKKDRYKEESTSKSLPKFPQGSDRHKNYHHHSSSEEEEERLRKDIVKLKEQSEKLKKENVQTNEQIANEAKAAVQVQLTIVNKEIEQLKIELEKLKKQMRPEHSRTMPNLADIIPKIEKILDKRKPTKENKPEVMNTSAENHDNEKYEIYKPKNKDKEKGEKYRILLKIEPENSVDDFQPNVTKLNKPNNYKKKPGKDFGKTKPPYKIRDEATDEDGFVKCDDDCEEYCDQPRSEQNKSEIDDTSCTTNEMIQGSSEDEICGQPKRNSKRIPNNIKIESVKHRKGEKNETIRIPKSQLERGSFDWDHEKKTKNKRRGGSDSWNKDTITIEELESEIPGITSLLKHIQLTGVADVLEIQTPGVRRLLEEKYPILFYENIPLPQVIEIINNLDGKFIDIADKPDNNSLSDNRSPINIDLLENEIPNHMPKDAFARSINEHKVSFDIDESVNEVKFIDDSSSKDNEKACKCAENYENMIKNSVTPKRTDNESCSHTLDQAILGLLHALSFYAPNLFDRVTIQRTYDQRNNGDDKPEEEATSAVTIRKKSAEVVREHILLGPTVINEYVLQLIDDINALTTLIYHLV